MNEQNPADKSFLSVIKKAMAMMINPGSVVRKGMEAVPWQFSIIVSGLSFALVFFQTGLDISRANGFSVVGFLISLSFFVIGALYGTAGVALISLMAWGITKKNHAYNLKWTISNFSLGFSSTLIYAVIGLLMSFLIGWNTSVAFGVTGVLWGLRPIQFTVMEMSGEKMAISILVTTLTGLILLAGWAAFGNITGFLWGMV